MKIRILLFALTTLVVLSASAQNKIIINTDQGTEKISKYIYGHFSEHLGTCIYGGIYVGEDSQIPNIKGFRTDVVNALKEMKVPVLRWPGGCFADTYHWKDGIGPKEDRPSIVNVNWGGVTEDNSFGTHEFLNFCELIGAEPYLSINVGSGTVQEAAEWVEYCTSSNESPMTDLRKKNGREEPWNVKFWGIGNETWGCGGDMRPEYYADIYRQYAGFVRGRGLQKIICGPSSGDTIWTEKIIQGLNGKMHLTQGVSLHHYTLPSGSWAGSKGSSTDFGEDMYFKTMLHTYQIEDIIRMHWAVMNKYDPRGRVKLVVDEWGTWYDKLPGTKDGFLQQQNTVRDAVVAGTNLNIFNNNADKISMANIAQIVNVLQSVILTKDNQMVKTPTYYVFKMYAVHQDATLLPSDIQCEKYSMDNESVPAITSSASKDANGKIHVTISNLNPNKAIDVTCDMKGLGKVNFEKGSIVTGEKMNSYNDFGKDEQVTLKSFSDVKVTGNSVVVQVPAKSVVMVELD